MSELQFKFENRSYGSHIEKPSPTNFISIINTLNNVSESGLFRRYSPFLWFEAYENPNKGQNDEIIPKNKILYRISRKPSNIPISSKHPKLLEIEGKKRCFPASHASITNIISTNIKHVYKPTKSIHLHYKHDQLPRS